MTNLGYRPLTTIAAALVCLCHPAGSAQIRSTVPVMIGGKDASEGCAGTAIVTTAAGGTLNLRAGPGLDYPVLARLAPGRAVSICQRRQGGWAGIVVLPEKPARQDCALSEAGPQPRAYAGKCDSGWVSDRYLRIQAG